MALTLRVSNIKIAYKEHEVKKISVIGLYKIFTIKISTNHARLINSSSVHEQNLHVTVTYKSNLFHTIENQLKRVKVMYM